MDKHNDDLELFENRIKKTQTSLMFVILSWVITLALGGFVYYTLNYSIGGTIIFGLNFIILLTFSSLITLRYFHLEPIAREIIYLNKEIARLNKKMLQDK